MTGVCAHHQVLQMAEARCVTQLFLHRYLYLPMLSKRDDEDHITYRRYKLSDEKSFANFFHPEKQALLTLVDNFNQKKGKFAIQGYPQKLGFLVHGPPGMSLQQPVVRMRSGHHAVTNSGRFLAS